MKNSLQLKSPNYTFQFSGVSSGHISLYPQSEGEPPLLDLLDGGILRCWSWALPRISTNDVYVLHLQPNSHTAWPFFLIAHPLTIILVYTRIASFFQTNFWSFQSLQN